MPFNAVVSKLIAASRGSPCDSMASCLMLLFILRSAMIPSVLIVPREAGEAGRAGEAGQAGRAVQAGRASRADQTAS